METSTGRFKDGGLQELMALAWPLILSNSLWTLQITIDRMLLSWSSTEAVAAAMPAVMLFWAPLALLQNVAGYATVFVAQYQGAGRPERIGPAVWQAVHFSILSGLSFLLLLPFAALLLSFGGHEPAVLGMEIVYFRCLCFAAMPMLLVAAVSGYFSGRGDSRTVLLINTCGLVTNALLDYWWIFGGMGLPAGGIEGAGWATVVGTSVSAVVALALFLRPSQQRLFGTWSGWRMDGDLFLRLMRFGIPNGLAWMLDTLAFTVFVFFVGWLGKAELAATSLAFSINLVAVLPVLGVGQAVEILVGQRLGQDRPDLAEKSTWTGFRVAFGYMTAVAAVYFFAPGACVWFFASRDPEWATVAAAVVILLRFVAVYSLFDSMNLVFSFALRGAGDTLFVTIVSVTLSWPIMLIPTWVVWHQGGGLYWAWTFASSYVIALALTFLVRFLGGRWKSMRVIEPTAPVTEN